MQEIEEMERKAHKVQHWISTARVLQAQVCIYEYVKRAGLCVCVSVCMLTPLFLCPLPSALNH